MTAYCDGSCIGNPGPGGWAAILIEPATGKRRTIKGQSTNTTTNGAMELTACIEALSRIAPGAHVTIIADAEYVVRTITEWLPKWEANGWRKGKGSPVKNKALVRALKAAIGRHASVTAEWVKSHPTARTASLGDPLNAEADQIARTEARIANQIMSGPIVRQQPLKDHDL